MHALCHPSPTSCRWKASLLVIAPLALALSACPEEQQVTEGSDAGYTGGYDVPTMSDRWMPAGDAAEGSDAVSSGQDAANPGQDAANPGQDAANPGQDAANPGQDAANPGQDAANPGQDAANPGQDAGDGDDDEGVYQLPDPDSPVVPELCPAADEIAPGCQAELEEGPQGLCDGLDNDCDGQVDEACSCKLGEVQRCFRGPPGRHDEGACEDGQQTCFMVSEGVNLWGPCEGGISPTLEVCDDLDNDCNGCLDELEACVDVVGSCPGPGDSRVPEGVPFSTYPLNGADFYPGTDVTGWQWEVTGTPCDRLFLSLPDSPATSENGQLSYTLSDADQQDASIDFTLSGDYAVTMTATLEGGGTFSCNWIVHVVAPGLRVELCWDATGPTASEHFDGTVDVDLHMGKTGLTPAWFDGDDCDYISCDVFSDLHDNWGYASSPIENCTGPGARGTFSEACPNPRLDIDNVAQSTQYVPENINLDNPNDGDQFRVMVHHYTSTTRLAKPLVNVYCGGELLATYGQAPNEVESFDEGGSREGGDMWRVADITTHVDAQGDTTGCDLTLLEPPGGSGYYLTLDDPTY